MNSDSPSTTVPFDSTAAERVSEAVVSAVADAKDISAVDVSPPLYDVIDPDALEALVASMTRGSGERAGTVEFSYSGYEVTVTGDGFVSVTPVDPLHQKTASPASRP